MRRALFWFVALAPFVANGWLGRATAQITIGSREPIVDDSAGPFAVSANGDRVLFVTSAGEIALMERSSGSWTRELVSAPPSTAPVGLTLDWDGTTAFVTLPRDDRRELDVGIVLVLESEGGWHETVALQYRPDLPLVGAANVSDDAGIAIVATSARDQLAWFSRRDGGWVAEAPLVLGDIATSIGLSGDGARLLFTRPSRTADLTDCGIARTLVRAGSTWRLETMLSVGCSGPDAPLLPDEYGATGAISGSGDVVLVSAPLSGFLIDVGTIRSYERTDAWRRTTAFSGTADDAQLGRGGIALSEDGRVAMATDWSRPHAPGDPPGPAQLRIYAGAPGTWAEVGAVAAEAGLLSRLGNTVIVQEASSLFAVPLLRGPASCRDATECPTGHCVDGVCCDTACGDGRFDCEACSTFAGGVASGTCGPMAPSRSATVTCRYARSPCDIAEQCVGGSRECPADEVIPDGRSCPGDDACLGACASGECLGAPTCSASGDACSIDSCVGAATCTVRRFDGCCESARDCDDLDPCTIDRCTSVETDFTLRPGTLPLLYETSGDAPWGADDTSYADPGRVATIWPALVRNQSSRLSVRVASVEPTELTFRFRMDSLDRDGYDTLPTRFDVLIDDVLARSWTTSRPWTPVTVPLTAGAHTIAWVVSAFDSSDPDRYEAKPVWLDDISLAGSAVSACSHSPASICPDAGVPASPDAARSAPDAARTDAAAEGVDAAPMDAGPPEAPAARDCACRTGRQTGPGTANALLVAVWFFVMTSRTAQRRISRDRSRAINAARTSTRR